MEETAVWICCEYWYLCRQFSEFVCSVALNKETVCRQSHLLDCFLKRQYNAKVKAIHSDNGTEVTVKVRNGFRKEKCVFHQYSVPAQHNRGIPQRRFRTIWRLMRQTVDLTEVTYGLWEYLLQYM